MELPPKPPGVNLADDFQVALNVTGITFWVLAVICVALRMASRKMSVGFWWDDWFAVLAVVRLICGLIPSSSNITLILLQVIAGIMPFLNVAWRKSNPLLNGALLSSSNSCSAWIRQTYMGIRQHSGQSHSVFERTLHHGISIYPRTLVHQILFPVPLLENLRGETLCPDSYLCDGSHRITLGACCHHRLLCAVCSTRRFLG